MTTSDVTDADVRHYRDEAEATRDEPLSANATRPGLARSKVLQVRLNPEEWDALQRYAEHHEAPASAIVRGWILDRLNDPLDDETLPATVAHLSADMDRLQRIVRAMGYDVAATERSA